jgi:DNA-binding response OmpR family regulator
MTTETSVAPDLRLLVADDDPSIATLISFGARLIWPDCHVVTAGDGATALRRFAVEQPHLVVLDIQMPSPDGFAVCRRIREVSQVPILMLTVRADTMDKVHALDLGADDYLSKPFDHLELLARLRALVRRGDPARAATAAAGNVLRVGELTLNVATHEVRLRGIVVALTSTEYRLLAELARHAGRVLPHRYLLTQVWGPDYAPDTHHLRVFIQRLRRKLGDDTARPRYIQTDWNNGYRLVPAPRDSAGG